MENRISPEIEGVYNQLLWIEQRRARIVESVSAHFSQSAAYKILKEKSLLNTIVGREKSFSTLLDDRSPKVFLADLAKQVEQQEAATIHALRTHISLYQHHVDEQILFGARTAGQEAGRHFLSRLAAHTRRYLDVPEAVQAVFELTYNGLPDERNHFLCLRLFGGSTVHFIRSPHLAAWTAVGADPSFLFELKEEWIRGILDILSPETVFTTTQAMERGDDYGLSQFYARDRHAGP